VRDSLEKSIAFLERQIADIDREITSVINDDPDLRNKRDLLESIPGIGERVASTVLGELAQITEFRNGKALAALVGFCPREVRSGSSVSAAGFLKWATCMFAASSTCRRSPPCVSTRSYATFAHAYGRVVRERSDRRSRHASHARYRLWSPQVGPPLRCRSGS